MNTVISKRPSAFVYTKWRNNGDHTFTEEYSITVDGGAGVVNPKSLVTPQGVATFVDDDTLAKLMDVPKFKSDIERGLIRVEKGARVSDPEKVDSIAQSGKMMADNEIDGRPLTPEDLENDGAVVNSDGSVNVSNGGKDAVKRRKAGLGKKKGM